MSGKTYQISELAKLAGVTVRTIRYYISQGLLPSPNVIGQFNRYDDVSVQIYIREFLVPPRQSPPAGATTSCGRCPPI